MTDLLHVSVFALANAAPVVAYVLAAMKGRRA